MEIIISILVMVAVGALLTWGVLYLSKYAFSGIDIIVSSLFLRQKKEE
ncbi:MAG: hypothetical protein ABIG87_00685 [Patescibacteria group bacterium]